VARSTQSTGRRQAARRPLGPGHLEQIYGTIRIGLRCGMWVLVARYGYLAIDALSGKSTAVVLSWGLAVIADWRVSISVTLTGFAALWALLERRVRQRTVERLHRRIREVETIIDPNRSSSSLTPRGTTNPRDMEP
jgi:hypothetical protein